jgi:hypothetical protein
MRQFCNVTTLLVGLAMTGCGSTSDEVPPLSQPGVDPPAEQQRDWRNESASRSGYQSSDNNSGDTSQ